MTGACPVDRRADARQETFQSQVDRLGKQLMSAASSTSNRSRRSHSPRVSFGLETPIAEAKLFGHNVNALLSDPACYLVEILREKLWRWNSWPNDPTPLSFEVPAWLGHYPEYPGLGLDLLMTREGVPLFTKNHPLSRYPDYSILRQYELLDWATWGWQPRILRWYESLLRLSDERVPVSFHMTWWRGCLDLAIQMRGYEAFLEDTIERPSFVHSLLKWLVEQRCRWWEGYWHYMGQSRSPCSVADDWINVPFISPRIFREFVLPRYLDIETFHGGILGVHSCGNTTPVQRDLLEIQTLGGLEVSAWTDLTKSLENIPPEKHLAISLHPNDVLVDSVDDMYRKLQGIVDLCHGRDYSVGTSGLTPITPEPDDFILRISRWLEVVHAVMEPVWDQERERSATET
jgi:hypothetical protein